MIYKSIFSGVSTGFLNNSINRNEEVFSYEKKDHATASYRFNQYINLTDTILLAYPNPSRGLQACIKLATRIPALFALLQPKFKSEMLPPKDYPLALKTYHILLDNTGTIVKIARVVTALALLTINPYYGGAVLVTTLYGEAEKRNMIPLKAGLFIETYATPFILTGGFLFGGWIQKTITVFILGTTCWDSFNQAVTKIHDTALEYLKTKFNLYNNPFEDNTEMPYAEILHILSNDDNVIINHAHCEKPIIDTPSLETDYDFNFLSTLFKKINWNSKYDLLQKKLSKDPLFIDFLQTEFPEIPIRTLKEDLDVFNQCVSSLAAKKELSKETFITNKLSELMTSLLSTLERKNRPIGSLKMREYAIYNTAKVVSHLKNIESQEETSLLESTDILSSLLIDGAGHSANILTVTAGHLAKTIETNMLNKKISELDFSKKENFRLLLEKKLEQTRKAIVSGAYDSFFSQSIESFKGIISPEFKRFLTKSIEKWISPGFFYIPQTEKNPLFPINYLLNFDSLRPIHQSITRVYKEDLLNVAENTRKALGNKEQFLLIIQDLINKNTKLTSTEKTTLIQKIQETELPLKRLDIFLMTTLGILKKPNLSE